MEQIDDILKLEGYSLDFFINQDIAQKFICVFCHIIPHYTLICEHKNCGTFFCYYHIESSKKDNKSLECPNCKKEIVFNGLIQSTNKFAYKMICELKMRCPFNTKICKWADNFENIDYHTQSCEYSIKHCKYFPYGCHITGPFSILKAHYEKCKDEHLSLLEKQLAKLMPKSPAASILMNGSNEISVISDQPKIACTSRNPLPQNFIVDIEIINNGKLNIGISAYQMFCQDGSPQWNKTSINHSIWVYASQKGIKGLESFLFYDGNIIQGYGEPLEKGDIVRMEIMKNTQLQFYKNGKSLGVAFNGLKNEYYLFVCVSKGAAIKVKSINHQ